RDPTQCAAADASHMTATDAAKPGSTLRRNAATSRTGAKPIASASGFARRDPPPLPLAMAQPQARSAGTVAGRERHLLIAKEDTAPRVASGERPQRRGTVEPPVDLQPPVARERPGRRALALDAVGAEEPVATGARRRPGLPRTPARDPGR